MEITSLAIVNGNSFCPDDSKSFEVTFRNNHASSLSLSTAPQFITMLVNSTDNSRAIAKYTVKPGKAAIAQGNTQTLTFPTDFYKFGTTNAPTALNFSTSSSGNTLTVSMSLNDGATDTVPGNDVKSLSGIVVFTPRTPSLSSTAAFNLHHSFSRWIKSSKCYTCFNSNIYF